MIQWRQGGRLVDFQITVRVRTGEAWRTVFEVDCQHGHVHSHETAINTLRGVAVHIYRLDALSDLPDGLTAAIDVTRAFIDEHLWNMAWGD